MPALGTSGSVGAWGGNLPLLPDRVFTEKAPTVLN